MRSSNLKERLKVSSWAVPLVLLTIYLSAYPLFMPLFMIVITAAIAIAVWEYYQIAETKGLQPLIKIGVVWTCAYALAVFISTQIPAAIQLPYIVSGVFLALAFAYLLLKRDTPLVTLAVTIFGIFYLTIPLSFMIKINYDASQDGRWWLLYLMATAKMTDTGAYIIGKLFGKTPLAPTISPQKTWEGALGGLAIGVATSVGFVALLKGFFPLSFASSLWLGCVISILAQFGDLAESLLKRDAGVKDSSHIPGIGGVLDIVDSLVFAVPFLYLFMDTL